MSAQHPASLPSGSSLGNRYSMNPPFSELSTQENNIVPGKSIDHFRTGSVRTIIRYMAQDSGGSRRLSSLKNKSEVCGQH